MALQERPQAVDLVDVRRGPLDDPRTPVVDELDHPSAASMLSATRTGCG